MTTTAGFLSDITDKNLKSENVSVISDRIPKSGKVSVIPDKISKSEKVSVISDKIPNIKNRCTTYSNHDLSPTSAGFLRSVKNCTV
ncbi:hypothetical protein [Phascolarctobacterium succinatutens]|uniref:hypothetical protein n=1 Tax=Phascolarctobacterium succinatutens TaxID=626940 RepID=UPI0026F11A4F|nr:hypothetical protein [Phascolarctobacterium succinatutens]